MKYKAAIKAGRLANGWERGKGTVVHAVESDAPFYEESICGTRPSNQWIEKDLPVTCSRCLKRIRKEEVMSNLLNQVDEMIKEG